MTNIKPTLKNPMSPQSEKFEKDFSKTMVKNNVSIQETTDSRLDEVEQSLKKKIFSLQKMESLVFSDPKLSNIYDGMAENGEEKYGYHYNETIQNMIFNDYVLNSPKYLQKYKMAIPKEKKRRDKSGINQLKKAGIKKMTQSGLSSLEKSDVDESTSAGSAGGGEGYTGYAGPSAWSTEGDLLGNTKKDDKIKKPIWNGGTTIQESNYLTDSSGFEKYFDELNEQMGMNSGGITIQESNYLNEMLSVHDTVQYDSDRTDENIFEMGGDRWQFVNAIYPDGKRDIGVYRFGHDLVYDYAKWREAYNLNEDNNIKEDMQSMIQNNGTSMSNKAQPSDDQGGNVPMGMDSGGGMNEADEKLFEDINNELNAFSVHQEKLKEISEDRKTSSMILKDRLGDENSSNFKKDLKHSGTKDVIDVEKELMWKEQQTDIGKDPQKLSADLAKGSLESFENVGDSTNEKGNEIPKRNATTAEQEEVDLYRNGLHSTVFDNDPGERFEDRMKIDMGDKVHKLREKQLEFKGKAPMYNKDTQPMEDGAEKLQFDKNLKESMVTGRYNDILGKRRLIEFRLIEAKIITKSDDLFKLDFTGLGNTYNNKSINKKVIVNETVVNVMENYEFHTDGKDIFAIKNPVQNLNENEIRVDMPINEEFNKMKHLLGYKPDTFTNTGNIKKNRGF